MGVGGSALGGEGVEGKGFRRRRRKVISMISGEVRGRGRGYVLIIAMLIGVFF